MKTFDGFLHVSMRSPGVEAEDERKVVYTVSIKHVVLKKTVTQVVNQGMTVFKIFIRGGILSDIRLEI